MLGATDILGNPVSLISNLGRGVEELYSEPFQGLLTGDISQAASGLGRGVKGLVGKTAFGVGNSVAKLTGTWYVGLRGFSGRQVSESQLDNPHSIGSGVSNGAKGLGSEIVKGVAGVYTVPRQTIKDSGLGCTQVTKGTLQGVFGMVSSPITGLLKMLYSLSTGVKNQTHETRSLSRFRFPRYFNEREVMESYDPVLSHAQAALTQSSSGQWSQEVILFALDISCFTDAQERRYKDRIVLCTDKRVLYVQALSKIKLNILLRELTFPEAVGGTLVFHSTERKQPYEVHTGKDIKNQLFEARLREVVKRRSEKQKMKNSPIAQAVMPTLVKSDNRI